MDMNAEEIIIVGFFAFCAIVILIWRIKAEQSNWNTLYRTHKEKMMSSRRQRPTKQVCENCGKQLNADEVNELDGQVLCEDCFNEEEDLRAIEEEWI